MSIEAGKDYLRQFGLEDKVLEFDVSSATVELAAQAVGVEGKRIAKTLSFRIGEEPILILAAGDAKIDNKKYKDLPKFFYIDYLKEILYQFKEYGVEVSNLEELNKSKKDIQKDTSTVINKYHYSYKALILKGVISLAFIAGSVTIIILKDNNIFAYFLMMIAILVWTNGTKTGTLSLTEKGIILKKNFMRIEIPYEEVINIKLTEKNLVISSPFNFIEFEPIEEIALEVQKKVV